MSKDSKSVFKSFVRKFIPVSVVIGLVAFGVLYSQSRQFGDMVMSHEKHLLQSDYTVLSDWLESGVEAVSLLSGLVEKRLSESGTVSEKYNDLASVFAVFGRETKSCVQVRFLSPLGQELVRINVEEGRPIRTPDDLLQDKSTRTYFKDSLAIDDGVYISALNLNREFGKIEEPYLPVVRFIKNVHGEAGGYLGAVILNFSARSLLKNLKNRSNESFGDYYLVNSKGGLIICPDEKLEWNFLYGEKNGFISDLFPESWAELKENASGQFSMDGGVFTYTTLDETNFPSFFRFHVLFKEGWKIITRVDGSRMMVPWSGVTVVLMFFLFLLSAFFFWRKTIAADQSLQMKAALSDSEKRFMDVADAAGEFIWETGPDGSFVFVTGRARDILGYSAEELIGRSPFDFVDEESSWEVRKEFLDAAQNGRSFTGLVFRFVNREGRKLWLEFNGVPVFDEQGSVTGFRGATSDITAQQRALQDLQDREDMLQSISDSVQDALVLMDENGLIHFWNPAAEKIFGYSAAEMLGESLDCCIFAEDNEDISGDGEDVSNIGELFDGYGSFTVNVRRKGGTVFPAEVLLSPLRKDDKWWVVGTVRDVTERKEAEDKLRRLATTDPLTGLANRRFFMESADEALERSLRYERDLSLLMLDIDFFKNVNDMYGHDAGDDVLQGLAAAGLKILRKIDVFGRIGGEEFSVLLPDTGLEGAEMVAERLRREIEQTRMKTRAGELNITVSIGVASLNEEINTLEHLLKASDIGLYSAKHAGRNRVEVQLSPKGSVK